MKETVRVTSRIRESAHLRSLSTKWERTPSIRKSDLVHWRETSRCGKRSTNKRLKKRSSIINRLLMPKGRISCLRSPSRDCKLTRRKIKFRLSSYKLLRMMPFRRETPSKRIPTLSLRVPMSMSSQKRLKSIPLRIVRPWWSKISCKTRSMLWQGEEVWANRFSLEIAVLL